MKKLVFKCRHYGGDYLFIKYKYIYNKKINKYCTI